MKKENKLKNNMHQSNKNRTTHHSVHSLKRAAQRGIRNPWIDMVIREGKVIFKQGIRFFFITKKELRFFEPALQEKLKNLVVVMAGDDNTIITCYKNKDAISHIKRKSKRLL